MRGAKECRFIDVLPSEATGLQLFRIDSKDRLTAYEAVRFTGGVAAVDTILRRARISGHVEANPTGPLPDYFADVLDASGDCIGHVALDAGSHRSLRTHWMRCKVETLSSPAKPPSERQRGRKGAGRDPHGGSRERLDRQENDRHAR